MLFNSYIFLFLFLPVVLMGWYGINYIEKYKLAQAFLIGMSLWFYAYFHLSYLWMILASLFINFALSMLVTRVNSRKGLLVCKIAGIAINLGILGYFKYYDFFVENLNACFSLDLVTKNILLPLGISFFTFQQLSYVVDRCNKKAEHYDFLDYACFVTFFPQLIAGPIVLHSELVPQFQEKERRKFNGESFLRGIAYFVIGFAKKVVIADSLIAPVDYGFTYYTGLDSISAILVALCFTFQLYFDFSGYCDMAIGLGKMFGMELPDNFDSPHKSKSVKEFWRRWHITLGRFFTTYVYFPLGGSRKGKARMVLNNMIVFFLSGFWHGANWTYVVWGLVHGVAVSFNSLFGKKEKSSKNSDKTSEKEKMRRNVGTVVWDGVKTVVTFMYVSLALVIFRSDNLKAAWIFYKQLFTPCYSGRMFIVASKLELAETYLFTKMVSLKAPQLVDYANFICLIGILVLCIILTMCKNTRQIVEKNAFKKGFCFWLALLFTWSVISLSGVSTFLYFNF